MAIAEKEKKQNAENIVKKNTVDNFEECGEEETHTENIKLVIPILPNNEEFDTLASFFSVFSDPTRLKIISALSSQELCVCDLAELLKMKQPSVSQHLKTLWLSRVVKKRKVGLQVFYKLDDYHIKNIYKQGYEHVKE